ncbi:MAG: RNA polymerase sigma factor [Chitinophagaceae bacterium]
MITELLIENCMNNDRKAQRALYEWCFPILIRVCKRYSINEEDAIDTMNTCFLKILKNLHTINDINTLPGWVKRIAVNTSIDAFRKNKSYQERTKFTIDTEYSAVMQSFYVNSQAESQLDRNKIFELINILPDVTKQVLNLFAIDGYSHKEIADMLTISEEASRWHLFKARKILTEKIQHLNMIKMNQNESK